MFCNILHRVNDPDELDAIRFQQNLAHELGFRTTMHVSLQAMDYPEVISFYKEQLHKYNDELGIHFHNLWSQEYTRTFGTNERLIAIYLKPLEDRKKIIDLVFEKFHTTFGFYPVSIGGYFFDAVTLAYIKEKYPSVKIATISCFEEGINMFAGCNYGWYVFSEGGPWTAFYPAKENSLCPAQSKEDAIDIIGVPHLSRDMLMSYLSRDDYFSSHTANMQRGLLNEGKECQYIYDFLDEWLKQEQYNDVVYFNNYTGAGWLNDGRNYGAPSEVSRDLYRQCLQYYREKADEGSLQVVTMSEYAKIHEASYTFGKGEVNFWRDLACNSGRELIWYVDSFWRIALDPNCGGSLVDLRPYIGRVTQDLGPNSAQMWNGSYPFALNMLHRGAGLTASVGSTSLFGTRMHTDKVERTPDGAVRVSLKPIDLENDQGNITISAEYDFYPDGRILLKKKLLAADYPDAIVPISETFKGTHGRTEYPEDIGNAVLSMQDTASHTVECRCSYNNRRFNMENAVCAAVSVPELNVSFSLEGTKASNTAEVFEGTMFDPFYYISMTQKIRVGEESCICLKVRKLSQR